MPYSIIYDPQPHFITLPFVNTKFDVDHFIKENAQYGGKYH